MPAAQTIESLSSPGVAAPGAAPSAFALALARLGAAERQVAGARRDARHAQEQLALAEEQLVYARRQLRAGRPHAVAGAADAELIGMGYFADELAFGD
jgi:hypothetical protein